MLMKFPAISFAPEGSSGPASGVAAGSEPSSAPSAGGTSPSPSSSSSPSGATSTLSETTTSSTPSESEDSGVDFGSDFFTPLSEVEVDEPAEAVEAKPDPKTPVQKSKETPKEAAPPAPQVPEPQKPTEQPKADEAAAETTASIPLHEPGRLADAMRQNQAQLMGALAESYKLSPEDVEALETDAAQAIPKLLAKAHFNIVTSIFQNLQGMIPAVLQQSLSTYQSAQENLDKFFSAWPQLDKVTHRAEVLNMAKQYRQLNPKMAPEQMIRDVGALVALKVGVPLQQPAAGASQHPMAAVSSGGRLPPASPFVPAGNGVAAPPMKAEEHPFGGLYVED